MLNLQLLVAQYNLRSQIYDLRVNVISLVMTSQRALLLMANW